MMQEEEIKAGQDTEEITEQVKEAKKPEHPEAALEAILFAYGNSVQKDRLMETLSLTEEELERAVKKLEEDYASSGRGITITRLEDSYQLGT